MAHDFDFVLTFHSAELREPSVFATVKDQGSADGWAFQLSRSGIGYYTVSNGDRVVSTWVGGRKAELQHAARHAA